MAGRDLAAAFGCLLILFAGASVIGTVVVPRRVGNWLTVAVDRVVDLAFHTAADRFDDYRARDRLLAVQAPAVLLTQLVSWLGAFEVGFALLLWPFVPGGPGAAFVQAGSSLITLGYAAPQAGSAAAVDDLASFAGLVTIALQIGYLPTLYGAFNRRETEVTLLDSRSGVPSWGPELLARTHYGLGTGSSAVHTLPELYRRWERWAADVAESHATYLPLMRFRSPRPLTSWVTSLLAVLDSAALYVSLLPETADAVSARLCLRGGFTCFIHLARALGADVPEEANPDDGIQLRYDEFLDAIERLRRVDFPLQRTPEQAWPDFVGWRVNYEAAAYAVARAVDAPPALWSGPRRHDIAPIPPLRPADRRFGRPPVKHPQ